MIPGVGWYFSFLAVFFFFLKLLANLAWTWLAASPSALRPLEAACQHRQLGWGACERVPEAVSANPGRAGPRHTCDRTG